MEAKHIKNAKRNAKKNKRWHVKRKEAATGKEDAEIAIKMAAEQAVEVRKAGFEYKFYREVQQFGLYKGCWLFDDGVRERDRRLSVLEISEEKDFQLQFHLSRLLDRQLVLDVLGLDSFDDGKLGVILDGEIDYDLKTWYEGIQTEFDILQHKKSTVTWWEVLKPKFKAFRGVFNALLKLYPSDFHGNWVNGIAFIRGRSVLYNMRSRAAYGCDKDLKELLKILTAILLKKALPEEGEDIVSRISVQYDSPEVFCFMSGLRGYVAGRNRKYHFDIPFFWNNKEKTDFMLKIYEFIWLQDNRALINLMECHFANWHWKICVPKQGRFRELFDCYVGGSASAQTTTTPGTNPPAGAQTTTTPGTNPPAGAQIYWSEVDYVRYWHDVRQHYKDKAKKSSLENLEKELEETFDACWRIHNALWHFINDTKPKGAEREWVLHLKVKVKQHLNWA